MRIENLLCSWVDEVRNNALVLLCRSDLAHVRVQEDTENDPKYELPFS